MQKSHIYILIILAVGFFLAFQWQINKMDRKLTCIYNSVNALPSFVVPELRADRAALQEQIDYVESSCDKGYIFLGFPKQEFAAKEKLEIVSGAAPSPFRIFAGELPRRRRRRNAFGLIQEYCTRIELNGLYWCLYFTKLAPISKIAE